MTPAVTYHLLPRAIAWANDDSRFLGAAVRGVVCGFAESSHYHRIAAGSVDRPSPSEIDVRVTTLLTADANPIVPLMIEARTVETFMARWNELHRLWPVAIDTTLERARDDGWTTTRRCVALATDSPLQRTVMASCLRALREALHRHATASTAPGQMWPWQLAGARCNDNAVAACAEALADTTVHHSQRGIARRVGCSSRTLQRELQRYGLTLPVLRSARRLVEAATKIRHQPGICLTDLAYDCGFSDSAHFANCFRRSTAISPSNYARLAALQG
jgi:AraC-like DNA-binding protein